MPFRGFCRVECLASFSKPSLSPGHALKTAFSLLLLTICTVGTRCSCWCCAWPKAEGEECSSSIEIYLHNRLMHNLVACELVSRNWERGPKRWGREKEATINSFVSGKLCNLCSHGFRVGTRKRGKKRWNYLLTPFCLSNYCREPFLWPHKEHYEAWVINSPHLAPRQLFSAIRQNFLAFSLSLAHYLLHVCRYKNALRLQHSTNLN